MRGTTQARLGLAAMACAGIASAHWLAYAIAAGDPHQRHELLSSMGHSYWPYAVALAVAALVAGLAGPLIQGFRGKSEGPVRCLPAIVMLAAIQMGGFLVLEVTERALFAPGRSLSILSEPVVVWGLLLQIVTAAIGAVVARLLVRVGAFIATLLRTVFEHRSSNVGHFSTQFFGSSLGAVTAGPTLRGPPSLR